MNKNLFWALSLTAMIGISFSSISGFAGPLSEMKEDELQNQYYESEELNQNTLATPLRFAEKPEFINPLSGTSLLSGNVLEGSEGHLAYQAIDGLGYRLRFNELLGRASFFLVFDKPMDIRNRWFRLRYTGIGVPERLALVFDHDEKRNEQFFVYLESSTNEEIVYFKLPDTIPYTDIHSVRLIADPELSEAELADFLILGIDILSETENPMAGLPETDLSRFDWFSNPLKADNEVALNLQA